MTQAETFLRNVYTPYTNPDPEAIMTEALDAAWHDAARYEIDCQRNADGGSPTLTLFYPDQSQVTLEFTGARIKKVQ